MKILLVQPNSSDMMVGFSALVRPEPLALEIIAATTPQHEVKILDLRIDPTLEATLSSFKPDLVGVTGMTTDVPRMHEICSQVKNHRDSIVTVIGGYHATLCPQDFDLDYIDIIVVGEGEITFRELVSALEDKRDLSQINGLIYRQRGRQRSTPLRKLVRQMDDLPLPARHLTDHYRSHYHFHFWENPYLVETARGCPYRCTFCAVWKFHQSMCRLKSPERVLTDLKDIPSQVVCCVDDNFLQNLRRAEKLYELVKAEGVQHRYWIQCRADSVVKRPDIVKKWSEVGLMSALVGFEKFRDEELVSVNKRSSVRINEKAMHILQDNGVDIWGAFIIDPQWTGPDFDALIDYVRSMKIVFPFFTVLTPLPGTAFFQEKIKELTTRNYEIFDFLHTVLPTKLPLEDFYKNVARLYANTTMGWAELKRRVRSGQIPTSALGRVRNLLSDLTNPEAYLRNAGTV